MQRTRWYPASGTFQRFFDDVLAPATRALPRELLEPLEPWPLRRLRPFQAEHLAGLQARTYDVGLGDGFAVAQERIRGELRGEVRGRIGGDVQRIDRVDVSYDALQYRHLLLPLYLLSYRYGKKVYRVVVNAGPARCTASDPGAPGRSRSRSSSAWPPWPRCSSRGRSASSSAGRARPRCGPRTDRGPAPARRGRSAR